MIVKRIDDPGSVWSILSPAKRDKAVKAALVVAGQPWLEDRLPKRFGPLAADRLGYTAPLKWSESLIHRLLRSPETIAKIRSNMLGGWDPWKERADYAGALWNGWYHAHSHRIRGLKGKQRQVVWFAMRHDFRAWAKELIKNEAEKARPGLLAALGPKLPLVLMGGLRKKALAAPVARSRKTRAGEFILKLAFGRDHALRPAEAAVLRRLVPGEGVAIQERFMSHLMPFLRSGAAVDQLPAHPLTPIAKSQAVLAKLRRG